MTLITLKFSPEVAKLVLQGRKCCTTRDEIKGIPGDIFKLNDRVYRIVAVIGPLKIRDMILPIVKMEGFNQYYQLYDELGKYYPQLNPDFLVYYHLFAYVGDWCPQFGNPGAVCSEPEKYCELFHDCHGGRY